MGFSIGFSLGPVRWSMPLGGGGRAPRKRDTTTWAERREHTLWLKAQRARLRREREALEAQADPAVVFAAHARANCVSYLGIVAMILGGVLGESPVPSDFNYVFHLAGWIWGGLIGYSIVLVLTSRWVAVGEARICESAEHRREWTRQHSG